MEYRSSNALGYVHFQGDLVTNVSSNGSPSPSSHGVQLTGGSTGGVVTAAGDETNVALNVRAKGSAPLYLGALAGGSTLAVVGTTGGSVQFAGSTSNFGGFIYFSDTAVAINAVASTEQSSTLSTHVITGSATNSIVIGCSMNINSTSISIGHCFASDSTAGDVHCVVQKLSTAATGALTGTMNFVVLRFNK